MSANRAEEGRAEEDDMLIQRCMERYEQLKYEENAGNAKGRGEAAGLSRGWANQPAQERHRENACIGGVHCLNGQPRRLKIRGGRTFFGTKCIFGGQEWRERAGGPQRIGWVGGLTGWMDGRADSYGLSVRTANGTPCYFATLV